MFGNGHQGAIGLGRLEVIADPSKVRVLLEDWLEWCEQFHVAVEAPRGEDDGELWKLVFENADCLGAIHASRLQDAEPALVRVLQESGRLRVFADPAEARGNLLWFVRGVETRVAWPGGAVDDELLSSSRAPWVFLGGATAELPAGMAQVLAALRSDARRPTDEELEEVFARKEARPVFQREVQSVRDVLPVTSGDATFVDLDEEARELALWSTLVGEGTLDLERAIRLAAERLRAQGWLEYQQLRQASENYRTIEECLLSARRRGARFDRPRSGHIRAIAADVTALTAADWRDCVMGGIAGEERIHRSQAIRQAFQYAQEVYGLRMQRLRTEGRPERAIKSAINSCVRQGYLQRDGAAYLIRRAEHGKPLLRGVIDVTERDVPTPSEASPDARAVEAPAAAEPQHEHAPVTVESVAPSTAPAEGAAEGAATSETTAPSEVTAAVTAAVTAEPPSETTAVAAPEGPEEEPGQQRAALLDRKLFELEFPTRTLNWAERKGITTIAELVAFDPDAFAQERNVGRLTVRQTRAALEEALGTTWERARAALASGAPAGDEPEPPSSEGSVEEETATVGGAAGWASCARTLGDRLREVPLEELELPARMRTFAAEQGLTTVGQLLAFGYEDLRARPNLGRKSLSDTLDAIQDYLSQREAPAQYATFLDSWRAQLTNLKPVHRLVVSRRAGAHGPRETLEEIAGMLGLTRERVRQIEGRVVERLQQKARWRSALLRRLGAAFGGARALPLTLLAEEPWWQGIDQQVALLGYVLRHVLRGDYQLFEAPSGATYVALFSRDAFDAALASAKTRIEHLEFPVAYDAVLDILRDECDALDPSLLDEMEGALQELLLLDERDPTQVNGFGRYRDAAVIAFLNAQDEPVPVSLLEEKVGRGGLPDEVLYFKRGVVGLKKHFPDFDDWAERLVPAVVDVMNQLPAGRQWLVPELHEELRARELLPDWMGHWHLASLLRSSGRVEYLGRLRVALRGGGQQQERLRFEDLFLELLEDAGSPLPFDELLRQARTRSDVREETAKILLNQAPFVRLDEARIGLVERDIPGGPEAVAVAVDAVAAHLAQTQRGLTPHQATLLVQRLSEVHAGWSRQLVVSLLRSEASLRIDRSKNIGLDEWDDSRCPTRAEFLRREVARAGGQLAIDQAQARMAELYGRAPDRGQLGALAAEVGLQLTGTELTHSPDAAPATTPPVAAPPTDAPPAAAQPVAAPPADAQPVTAQPATTPPTTAPPVTATPTTAPPSVRAPLTLQGIPAELRESFDELVAEPVSERGELRRQIEAHVSRFFEEYRVSEFVDLEGARTLREQSELLLSRWDAFTPGERQLAHAAIRYFVIAENRESDFDIGGLDDDKRIMAAVLEHLGIDDERHAEL